MKRLAMIAILFLLAPAEPALAGWRGVRLVDGSGPATVDINSAWIEGENARELWCRVSIGALAVGATLTVHYQFCATAMTFDAGCTSSAINAVSLANTGAIAAPGDTYLYVGTFDPGAGVAGAELIGPVAPKWRIRGDLTGANADYFVDCWWK